MVRCFLWVLKGLQIYQNLDKAEKLEQVEFMMRNFVMSGKLEASSCKITVKKKKVLDFVCVSADMQVIDDTITVWFTSEIPVAFGPNGYHGLPGLILGIEKEGDMLVLASGIELSEPEQLEVPSNGQKINRNAFDKTVEEKIKEWEAKASTGYIFLRSQQITQKMASNLSRGLSPTHKLPHQSERFKKYDSTLLRVLQGGKPTGAEVFSSLFEKNGAQAVFKFLDEETNLAEEIKIMSSTPIITFGKAFLSTFS
jgi:hypothetical protein